MKKNVFLFLMGGVISGLLLAGCDKDNIDRVPEPTPMTVDALTSPANNADIKITDLDGGLLFEWSAAVENKTRADIGVTYMVVFDLESGDFEEPVYTVASDNNGVDTKVTISKNTLVDIARKAGAAAGAKIDLYWTVKARSIGGSLLSEKRHTISLTRPEPGQPLGPPAVTTLTAPADEYAADLAEIEGIAFSWDEAITDGESAVRYTLMFDEADGDFSEPLYTVLSASEGLDPVITLTSPELDIIAELAGAESKQDVTLAWAVLTTVEDENNLSIETRTLTITRLDEIAPAIVTVLKAPADDAEFDLATVSQIAFEWEAATWEGAGDVTYEVVFDRENGDFTLPLHAVSSGEEGKGTTLVISRNEMDAIAASTETDLGGSVKLIWKVRATSGANNIVLSEVSRTITVTRPSELIVFEVGDPLYINGDGSEAGQQFRFVNAEDYDYEIYTRIEAGMEYYFSTAEDGSGIRFAVNSGGTAFDEIAGSAAGATRSATAICRIRLNFETKAVVINTIDYIYLRWCNNANRDAAMTYMGRGVWKLSDHNVWITKPAFSPNGEERYKFVFQMDGKAKNESEHWGITNTEWKDRYSFANTPDGYRNLGPVATGQWAGAFKYPADLIDLDDLDRWFTDIILYMNNDRANYTHEYENWYDASSLPVPWTIDWVNAADSCSFVLIDQFLNKDKGTFWGSAKNVLNNSSGLYWQQAYPVHTMLYSHDRIKDSDQALAQQYRGYFEKWVANDGNNYTAAANRRNGFYCSYTDDMAWMSLVFLHASEVFAPYETAKKDTYIAMAKEIYDSYMLESSRVMEDDEGWGLRWRLSQEDAGKDTRNACTNTPAMIIACKLYSLTGTQKYLDDAIKLFDFMTKTGERVQSNGAVAKSPNILSYTQGTWIEACRLLYHITGESKYMDRATTSMTYTMSTTAATTTAAGVLRGEGQSADQSNFKGGLIPYMVNYANDTDMPADVRAQAKTFLIFNGETLWRKNVDRTLYPKMFVNFSWEIRYNVEGNPGSLGAHNSGAALLEGITRLK